ncbi:hypothetical protein TNCV_3958591 [Trichonephila clavipes]|nr:hypothetical protein TNCV_3958591 [Trichonephila clavipes]
MSPNSNPTIVMLQEDAGFISIHNVVPFHRPCPPLIAPSTAQTPVVPSQGRIRHKFHSSSKVYVRSLEILAAHKLSDSSVSFD